MLRELFGRANRHTDVDDYSPHARPVARGGLRARGWTHVAGVTAVVAAVFAAVVAGVLLPTEPAHADCNGPALSFDAGEVRRGEPITVSGRGFGGNCYDTGPPPDGEGVLGVPLSDIEIYVVQGDQASAEAGNAASIRFDTEVLVATGSADDEYQFATEIVIPAGIEPGTAGVIARWSDDGRTYSALRDPLVVLDAEPVAAPGEITTFGPDRSGAREATKDPFPSESDVTDGQTSMSLLLAIGAGILVLAGVIVWLIRRRASSTGG